MMKPDFPTPSAVDTVTPYFCSSQQVLMGAGPAIALALKWFEHAPGFVALLAGPKFTFVHANDAYKQLVGRDDLLGLPLLDALPEIAGQGIVELLHGAVERGLPHIERGREVLLRTPHGELGCRYVDFVLQPIASDSGAPVCILVQGSDVSLETISQRGLQHSLNHDRLTGLPNYGLFRDRLEQAVLGAERGRRTLVVAALDLNRFKRVNACFGHEAGDRVLCEIAARLIAAAGPAATVARDNSDKFLLLLEADPQVHLATRVQALVAAVSEPIACGGEQLYVSCSVGVATYPAHGTSADALAFATDRSLARAKEAGPGVVRLNPKREDPVELEHFQLGSALREAIEHEQLEVHYQPQVDLVSGRICGVEALVRWTHPVKGPIAPATLVGVAEDCGLIGLLGDWVLRSACTQMQQWRELGYRDLRVAVNLSARQFAMRGLEDAVVRALADTGLPPECLDLELTESLLMVDVEHAIECLVALKERGIRLALDDFGTGYSNLAYLQRFPIDVLKIDKSFLAGVPDADGGSAIVDAIINMGHSLGMRVVAEGVENEVQCDYLSRRMCDDIQGYFFSRPVPAAELTAMLARSQVLPEHLRRFNRTQPTLLLVDDDPNILSSLQRLLRNEGYRIVTASSGPEGLAMLAHEPVDVIVSGQRIPGMTGVEFLRSAGQLYPHTVRIVLSGLAELQSVADAVNAGAVHKFLTKPWEDEQLRAHLREAFSHCALANDKRLLTLEVNTANQQLAAVNRQLEDVLARQRRQIERGETSLDIVREALGNVPLPVLACDEAGRIVLANLAAFELLRGHGPLLGDDARRLFPDLPEVPRHASRRAIELRLDGAVLAASLQSMGHGTRSHGWLIVVSGALRGTP